MASYFDDHSLEDPYKARRADNNASSNSRFNPDLSHFMPREDTDETTQTPYQRGATSVPGAGDFQQLAQ